MTTTNEEGRPAKKREEATLVGKAFEVPLEFSGKDFKSVDCTNASFAETVTFVDCDFSVMANFEGAAFAKGIQFTNCVFAEK